MYFLWALKTIHQRGVPCQEALTAQFSAASTGAHPFASCDGSASPPCNASPSAATPTLAVSAMRTPSRRRGSKRCPLHCGRRHDDGEVKVRGRRGREDGRNKQGMVLGAAICGAARARRELNLWMKRASWCLQDTGSRRFGGLAASQLRWALRGLMSKEKNADVGETGHRRGWMDWGRGWDDGEDKLKSTPFLLKKERCFGFVFDHAARSSYLKKI